MNTRLIRKIDPQNPDQSELAYAAEIIKGGGVVVTPTETRYGLLVNINDKKALENLYELKNRPDFMASAIFLRSTEQISEWAEETPISQMLAREYLPGPLTLVLKNRSSFGNPVVVENKIGIRISPSPVIESLLELTGFPLTATSANLSGQPDCETIDQVFALFGNKIKLYLDSGRLNSLTSTVIECIGDKYKILRSGAIPSDEIVKKAGGIL